MDRKSVSGGGFQTLIWGRRRSTKDFKNSDMTRWVYDGSVGRSWTYLLSWKHRIYTCTYSNSSWRRTEGWLNRFCTKKWWRDHIGKGRRDRDMIALGTPPSTQQPEIGRDSTKGLLADSSALGAQWKNSILKGTLDICERNLFTNPSASAKWWGGNSWTSLWDQRCC